MTTLDRIGMSILALALATAPGVSHGQPFDHLEGFKATGNALPPGIEVNLEAAAELGHYFDSQSCQVRSVRELLVPVSKTVVAGSSPNDVSGPALTQPYVCYSLRCTNPDGAPIPVVDQFTGQTFRRVRKNMICLPATFVMTSCGDAWDPYCRIGTCGEAGNVCSWSIGHGCSCVPGDVPCSQKTSIAMCSAGDCPPGSTCTATFSGCTCE